MSEAISGESLDALFFDPAAVYLYEQERNMYQAAIAGTLEIALFQLNRTVSEADRSLNDRQVHLYDPKTGALTHIEHIAGPDKVESVRIVEEHIGKRGVSNPDEPHYRVIHIDVSDATVIGGSTIFNAVQLETWNTGLTRSKPVQDKDFVDALDISRIDPIEHSVEYLYDMLHRANVKTRLRQQAARAFEAEFNGDPESCNVTIVEAPTGPPARTRMIARSAATVGLAASVVLPLAPSALDSVHESVITPIAEAVHTLTNHGLGESFERGIDIVYPVPGHTGGPESF